MIIKPKHTTLIVCDSNFHQNVNDGNTYVNKLFNFIHQREGEDNEVDIITVRGKYSFQNGLNELNVDDRTKTSFVKSVNDYLNMFNSVVIITNYNQEAYLASLRNLIQEASIPLTQFGYGCR